MKIERIVSLTELLPTIPGLTGDDVEIEPEAANFNIDVDQYHRDLEANARIIMELVLCEVSPRSPA